MLRIGALQPCTLPTCPFPCSSSRSLTHAATDKFQAIVHHVQPINMLQANRITPQAGQYTSPFRLPFQLAEVAQHSPSGGHSYFSLHQQSRELRASDEWPGAPLRRLHTATPADTCPFLYIIWHTSLNNGPTRGMLHTQPPHRAINTSNSAYISRARHNYETGIGAGAGVDQSHSPSSTDQ